jgi:hypothetical protein
MHSRLPAAHVYHRDPRLQSIRDSEDQPPSRVVYILLPPKFECSLQISRPGQLRASRLNDAVIRGVVNADWR